MFKPPVTNPGLKRTLRPLYAQHQATPQAGFLDPTWNKAFDIYPGTVMVRKSKEIFTPYTGAAGQIPWGLSDFFLAPILGVDEISSMGTGSFPVWRGGPDAMFEILAPAFDPAGDWSLPTDGSRKVLSATNQGKLTPAVGAPAIAAAQFELVDVIGTDKIVVSFLVR